MSDIIYLSAKDEVPPTGYWDHQFIEDIFKEIPLSKSYRTVIIIPGAYQWDVIDQINRKISGFKKVLVIVTSDEECKFDVSKLKHPDMILYSQYGNGGRMFPLGYAPGTREALMEIGIQNKEWQWFWAGQINHPRREMLRDTLTKLEMPGQGLYTDGFSKGYSRLDYMNGLAKSKTAPCAPGNVSVDSFRLYEALEAGCIPIADSVPPLKSYNDLYWKKMFSSLFFPTFADYKELPKLIDQCSRFKNYNNIVQASWISWKNTFKEELKQALGIPKDDMVAVVPVSPIPSHPETYILEETLNSIRVHTNCPIIVTFDGVREEEKDKEAAYHEFQRRMLWKMNLEYKNVIPVIFQSHQHQSNMMKTVLNGIDIPMILYVEQDTPLTPDRDIDWEKCKDYIRSGKSNVIRFHFEEHIPEEHKYLMIGGVEDGMQKTSQWSQRPHLASQDIYRIIMELFSDDSNCFIEDYLYGQIQNKFHEEGEKAWDKWKIHIYHPEGGIKRSYHTDGRAGDRKFVDEQVW